MGQRLARLIFAATDAVGSAGAAVTPRSVQSRVIILLAVAVAAVRRILE
jgi:hypothetical protein